MAQTNVIDHIALTVPDIDQATNFLNRVFGAQIALEGLKTNEPPIAGPAAEVVFGMPSGGKITARRVLRMPAGANIELFQFASINQHSPAHTFDYGYQHMAIYVADLQETAHKFLKAGGKLLQTSEFCQQVMAGTAPHQGWLYGKTPWGSVIEMVTFQEA